MAWLVNHLFNIYEVGLIAYAVLSWVQHPQAAKIRDMLDRFYAPFLNPIRRGIGAMQTGGAQIDFSPMVLLIIVVFLQRIVVSALINLTI